MKKLGALLAIAGFTGIILITSFPQTEGWLSGTGLIPLLMCIVCIVAMVLGIVLLVQQTLRALWGDDSSKETYLVIQSGSKGGETQFLYLSHIDISADKALRKTFKAENVPVEIERNCIVRVKGRKVTLIAMVHFIPKPDKGE